MKKTTFLLCLLLAGVLSAQTDPLTQFFNKSFIPSLVAYDSISVSLDSGSSFNAMSACRQHYLVNGKIRTLDIYQGSNILLSYQGKSYDNHRYTVIKGVTATADSIDMMTYRLDQNLQDSIVQYYAYSNGSFQLFFEARLHYNSAQQPDLIDIYSDFGTGLVKVGDYRYYYDQGTLDSIYYTISLTGQGDGYMKYTYDSSIPGKLLVLDTYEDQDGDGEKDLVGRLLCKNNLLNQVVEITQLSADNNLNLQLDGAMRYDIRKKSTIGKKEVDLGEVLIYPNPVQDFLQLEYPEKAFETYSIIDLQGSVIQGGKLAKQIDTRNLPQGVYRILLNGETSISKPIVKN